MSCRARRQLFSVLPSFLASGFVALLLLTTMVNICAHPFQVPCLGLPPPPCPHLLESRGARCPWPPRSPPPRVPTLPPCADGVHACGQPGLPQSPCQAAAGPSRPDDPQGPQTKQLSSPFLSPSSLCFRRFRHKWFLQSSLVPSCGGHSTFLFMFASFESRPHHVAQASVVVTRGTEPPSRFAVVCFSAVSRDCDL